MVILAGLSVDWAEVANRCSQAGGLWGVGLAAPARALRNSADALLVYLYYSVFRVWAGCGGLGI
jgi:hypothetical protein